MKDKVHIRFPVGDLFFVVEGGSGYADAHPDSMTVALRERTAKSTPGRRVAVNFIARRAELMNLGLQLLELAQNMSPETLWHEKQERGGVGLPALAPSRGSQLVTVMDPEQKIRETRDRYQNLKQRIAILRMAQQVLETCDPETAGSFHMLLVCAMHTGKLPMQVVVDAVERPVEEVDAS